MVAVALMVTAILVLPDFTFAGELQVRSFKRADNDLTAILNNFKRLDDNDQVCAIIKVRSDIEGLNFSASTPIVGNVEHRYGEYWIYVSEGTRQLSIYATGFIKLSYVFPERIESGKVYIMEVTSRAGTVTKIGKGNLVIDTDPAGVEVRIDGFPDLVKTAPCRFDNYRSGTYTFNFSKERYFPLDTIISIDSKVTKQIFVKLKPKWGDLVVSTDYPPVKFEIDSNVYEGTTLILKGEKDGLLEGIYPLRLSRENYYDTLINVAIKAGKTTTLQVVLRSIMTGLVIRTIPSGAEVYIDGDFKGKTPYRGSIITGKHQLVLKHKGFIDEVREINLVKDENLSLFVEMRTHTKVWINSSPDGAKIYLNGDYMGKTPEKVNIYTGKNTLTLKKKNYETIEDEITVVPDTIYSYTLTKRKYNLSVKSSPTGADIKINGKDVGQTNKDFDLEYGSYKVVVSNKGYLTRRKGFTLDDDEKLNFKLLPRIKGYIGVTFFIPSEDYDITKYGVELGWSYQQVPHLLTSFGYGYGSVSDMTDRFKELNISKVAKERYQDLDFNTMKKTGFAVEDTRIFYWRFGWIIYRPLVMTFTSVMGAYTFNGYQVYEADKDYKPEDGYGMGVIHKGEKLVDHYGSNTFAKFKYGFGVSVKLSTFFAGFDYWPKGSTENYGARFSVNVGIML
jgi:hypothetical protein